MKKIRILAFALAALTLLAGLAGCGKSAGEKPAGLFYEASGIDPKSTIAAINGREVSAEEYLYWLAYHCEVLVSQQGDFKWDDVISDGITYGEYAQRSALATTIQFCLVQDLANKYRVSLTDDDRASLQKQKDDDMLRYDGRDGYLRHLEMLGVSEETYDRINENYVLAARLVDAAGTVGSNLYPSRDTLDSFMEGRTYATVRLITLPLVGLDEEGRAAQEALLAECAEQIRQADDPCAKLAELSESLGQKDGNVDQTLGSDVVDLVLMRAVSGLKEGEVSDVITTSNAMCVALRRPLDESAVARDCFTSYLSQARADAKVEVSKSYKGLDVGKFYTRLTELRKAQFGDEQTVE